MRSLRILNAAGPAARLPPLCRPALYGRLPARPALGRERVAPGFAKGLARGRVQYRLASTASSREPEATSPSPSPSSTPSTPSTPSTSTSTSSTPTPTPPDDWEDHPNFNIEKFSELPHSNFGVNQHMIINDEFKEALRMILWQFRAPIRYAFAYGSGVFPQTRATGNAPTDAELRAIHPKAPQSVQRAQDGTPKMIDFIFGVTYTQHWHSLNLHQHRDHYSGLGALGSGAVSYVQDSWGAGVYYNPYVVVNGILVKYGVVSLDTLCADLSEWQTLYLAGRLHKPVKILRDDARVRLANQINLLSALRTALLLLPESFSERELYRTITAISYLGDPRMRLPTEDPRKVASIVDYNMSNFRWLYAPLIDTLPNVAFTDPRTAARVRDSWLDEPTADLRLVQDMDPVKRGNMVRRLPKAFRQRLYLRYQKQFAIPRADFTQMMAEAGGDEFDPVTGFRRQQGSAFDRRIVQDDPARLQTQVRRVIRQTSAWPSTTQSLKGLLTAGVGRSRRYLGEKMAKWRRGKGEAPKTESKPKPEPEPKPAPKPEPTALAKTEPRASQLAKTEPKGPKQ